ncbi:EcsC family protein [bacterium D16-51]|nr:EcsC family protein [bacterium D16-59]RKI56670.1 EcsC family protein [bacterium D16-51]
MNQKQIDREWDALLKSEKAFLQKAFPMKEEAQWQKKIEKYVPEKLEDTLNKAFYKAFELIFEKGTVWIEKTYDREKKEQDYKINEYAANLRGNAKSVKAFGRKAKSGKFLNAAISTVEGFGMGILGMGLPDIPLFLSVVLKSIYELALDYGFTYDTEQEQLFILKIIETAMLHGNSLLEGNDEIDAWMEKEAHITLDRQEQMQKASYALSKELLYLKFVQGVPVVGILGGVSDIIYQKKITDYAALKYKRRFLKKMTQKESEGGSE